MSIEDDAIELWCRGVRIVEDPPGESPLVWTPWDPRPVTMGAALVRLYEDRASAVFHRLEAEARADAPTPSAGTGGSDAGE